MDAQWLKERWPVWAAGVLLWVLLAAGATIYATTNSLNVWEQIVTWDEWAVAIGLLIRFLVPIFRRSEVVSRRGQWFVGLMGDMTWALAVVFLLDLLTRAVLGLGYEPF